MEDVQHFFNSETEVNNGFGCDHSDNEIYEEDEGGAKVGCCFCHACPLGTEADQEDLEQKDVNWDGLCEDGDVSEGEYLLIETGEEATKDQEKALFKYDRNIHRYDKEWLDAHGIVNSLAG